PASSQARRARLPMGRCLAARLGRSRGPLRPAPLPRRRAVRAFHMGALPDTPGSRAPRVRLRHGTLSDAFLCTVYPVEGQRLAARIGAHGHTPKKTDCRPFAPALRVTCVEEVVTDPERSWSAE